MLKLLTTQDAELIPQILPPREIENFKSTYLSGLTTWYAYGYFKDDKLVGISTAHYNGDAQEWFLLKQYADRGEDMEAMVSAVCSEFEKKELYRFFWIDADYYIDFMKNYIPDTYHHYKEYSMAPYMLPKNLRHYNILMNNNYIPTNTTVYMSVLPDDYRKK